VIANALHRPRRGLGSRYRELGAYKQPDALLGFHINMVNILAEDATPTTPRRRICSLGVP
jgi:hypothetical protein